MKYHILNLIFLTTCLYAQSPWEDVVSPKELEDNEVGLDGDRYLDLMGKLRKCIKKINTFL